MHSDNRQEPRIIMLKYQVINKRTPLNTIFVNIEFIVYDFLIIPFSREYTKHEIRTNLKTLQ